MATAREAGVVKVGRGGRRASRSSRSRPRAAIFTEPERVRPVEHRLRRDVRPAGDHRRRGRRSLGARLARRVGTRRVYLIGLAANLLAMTLLVVSALFTDNEPVAYACSCSRRRASGIGFGFTVPALNTFTAAFNPTEVDSSVLVLNALLGLGTALAPLFVAVFVGLGFWWGLPVLTAVTARRAARREPAPPAANGRPHTAAGSRIGGCVPCRHPAAVLALRRVRARCTASARP